MTKPLKYLFLLAPLFFAVACARHSDQEESAAAATLPALPSSWVGGTVDSGAIEAPSAESVKAVETAFRAHTIALEEVLAPAPAAAPGSHPADWVPWHLEGMTGYFAVDVGGVFGALVGDGVPAAKITWQKAATPRAPKKPRAAYRFNAGMTSEDVTSMLEPAVQMAVSNHSVRDGAALRRNLAYRGAQFLSAVKVLSHLRPAPGWRVDGFQLSLSVNGSGQVSPAVGVGGTVMLVFNWTVPEAAAPPPPLTARETNAEKNLENLVQTLTTLIPRAAAGAREVREAGFEFQEFQVGLGITAGGNVGIASAAASAEGRIVFKRNYASSLLAAASLSSSPSESLNVILPPEDPRLVTFAGDRMASIAAEKFQKGMQRAVKMGAFFAREAAKSESAHWKTNEIELGYDMTIAGDLGMATVGGTALVRLGFERVQR